MQAPRIAITFGSGGRKRSEERYFDRIVAAGAEPVEAPPHSDPQILLSGVQALLLTGGADIDPSWYNEPPVVELGTIDPARDATEIALVRAALQRDLPVLAICRGQQVLNVALGGRLQQHIAGDGHRAHDEGRGESRSHTVQIDEASVLAGIVGGGVHRVNSRHHQAVRDGMLGAGLLASAYSPDGVIEALESPSHRFVIAVQWHPERTERPEVMDDFRPLFSAFVQAARLTPVAAP